MGDIGEPKITDWLTIVFVVAAVGFALYSGHKHDELRKACEDKGGMYINYGFEDFRCVEKPKELK